MYPCKIRADISVNGDARKLVLTCIENETPEHLGLTLGAYLSFWDLEVVVSPSLKHSALMGQAFRPDLMAADISGALALWIECGNTSLHKLSKVLKRWPDARVAIFKESPHKAIQCREELTRDIPKSERVEIYAWPGQTFRDWMECLAEKIEVFGDVGGVGFNLVINDKIFATDLVKF